jgi:hypothetical protein
VAETPDGLKPLTPFRPGLVSDSTTELIVPCLVASALRYCIALDVVIAVFGQAIQEALDPQSRINRSKPTAILVVLGWRELALEPQLNLAEKKQGHRPPRRRSAHH